MIKRILRRTSNPVALSSRFEMEIGVRQRQSETDRWRRVGKFTASDWSLICEQPCRSSVCVEERRVRTAQCVIATEQEEKIRDAARTESE